jgi:hypothetical protein
MNATEQARDFIRRAIKPGKKYQFGDLHEAAMRLGYEFSSSTLSATLLDMARRGDIIKLKYGTYTANFNTQNLKKQIKTISREIETAFRNEATLDIATGNRLAKLLECSGTLTPKMLYQFLNLLRSLLAYQECKKSANQEIGKMMESMTAMFLTDSSPEEEIAIGVHYEA